ncbi:cyclophilin-like fold protein [Marinobacterium arenosum]|uniref:cyclophilin-like fold protein n=1 Tax=Marinobacterium arenosum TaxID=2862496 RepID=UPI001C958F9B|nr:cyclophilin-like fold protein [Marinobacterium arenosum]MBY4678161.1 hypothetical protein [Marinobacterium arenosum]
MQKISIDVDGITLSATLENNGTANAIAEALPIEGRANVWGEEIYFDIPLRLDSSDDAIEELAVGELAYWPPGRAFCLFFGPTPASTSEVPRAASPVNPFGRIEGDASALKRVRDGARITIRAL